MKYAPERIVTVPNVLSVLRLLGIAPLLWTAYGGHRGAFLTVLVLLLMSDWLDGKLAWALDQRTELGARLDSAVDVLMYVAVGLSFWWLESDMIRRHAWWFSVVAVSWTLSALVSMVRFRMIPSYHTWGAKVSWLVVGTTTVVIVLTGPTAAVPWALALVTATNLEAVAIGLVLPHWRADVRTLVHALRYRAEDRAVVGRDGDPGLTDDRSGPRP